MKITTFLDVTLKITLIIFLISLSFFLFKMTLHKDSPKITVELKGYVDLELHNSYLPFRVEAEIKESSRW